MKKFLLLISASLITLASFSQAALNKKKPALSVNFMMNDYLTAERLKNSSTIGILKDKKWSKITEMSPGLSVSYFQGLSNHVDFMGTLGGSFADYNFKNQPGSSNGNKFLLEADASINAKLLSDNYVVDPYVTAGVGIVSYKSSWGAFIPFGLGVQFKLSPESFLFTNFQYRVGITDRASNHFNYSIGFAGPIY